MSDGRSDPNGQVLDPMTIRGAKPNSSILNQSTDEQTVTEYPGLYGVAYRQYPSEAVPLFKNSDPPHRRPVLSYEGHVKVFDMSNTNDAKEYNGIIKKVSERKAVLCDETKHFDEAKHSYIVYVRWAEYYLISPDRAKELAHG